VSCGVSQIAGVSLRQKWPGAVAIILSIQPDPDADALSRLLQPAVDWIMGAIASAIITFFVVSKARAKPFPAEKCGSPDGVSAAVSEIPRTMLGCVVKTFPTVMTRLGL
jgi:hypothetical protein